MDAIETVRPSGACRPTLPSLLDPTGRRVRRYPTDRNYLVEDVPPPRLCAVPTVHVELRQIGRSATRMPRQTPVDGFLALL
jgi:hypothetical protein